MKLKAKISLLAGAVALMGVVYMPQASAAVYTLPGSPIEVPGASAFSNKVTSAGSFTDWLNFSLQSPGDLVGTLLSNVVKIKGKTSGVSLTSFELYSGNGPTPGTLLGTATVSGSSPGAYFANLDAVTLSAAPQTYTLKVIGNAVTAGSSYAGAVTVEAVPEPEEWAMMLVGAGLVSYQVRRKQKGLRQSVVA